MQFDRSTYRITGRGRFGSVALAVGLTGLALSALAWSQDAARFYHSWLLAFVFCLTLVLAGFFFTMLHHLANAKWSVVVRRVPESLMTLVPWLFLAFIPVYLGVHDLFHWSHPEALLHDEILQKKSSFLNPTFFGVRAVVYFAIWAFFALWLRRLSLKQDETGDPGLIQKMRNVSAGAVILFGFTVTFASFDWLMSLNPHWYSTIFGVYFFGGLFLSGVALITLILLLLRTAGVMQDVVTPEHYHDLGKLLLGFTIFWAYIGFAQYFLIWYANIPEETNWYQVRWVGNWKAIGYLLIFGHFAFPFLVLVFQRIKRNVPVMIFMTVWLLIMHWFDLYYLIYPTLLPDGFSLGWIELVTVVGLAGMCAWLFWRQYTARPLVPPQDPFLGQSLHHMN